MNLRHARVALVAISVSMFFALPTPSSASDPSLSLSALSDNTPSTASIDFELRHVRLRPGVRADLGVKLFGNPFAGSCQLAVHGFMHTAASWGPYAEASGGDCVLAIDMPGRGGSSLPTQIAYGELGLDDQVTALRIALRRLHWFFDIDTLIGHSQGALLIQRLQQLYIDRGSDLERRFGIEEVILLAPAHPAEVPSTLMDSGAALQVLQTFLGEDPELGTIVAIPAAFFPPVFFADPTGQVAVGAPSAATIEAEGYNAPAEPLVASLELSGSLGFARPGVEAGVFESHRGTRLRLLTHERDAFFPPAENLALYRYLTGDGSDACAEVIEGPDTIHDLYVLDPDSIVDGANGLETCSYGH